MQDDIVLGLPISAVLAQRFRLPTVDPSEFSEMVRIQVEKALPFSPDELTTDFEVIEQTETDSVVSAVAVRNDQLAELAAPLLDRGFIPRQVTVYAAQRAATHAPQGNTLLIYPEGEALVSAVTENGKLSLTRTLEGVDPEKLQMELPQLALSAELQGINASFPNVLLDETCYELRDTVQGILSSPTEIVGVEMPPATVKLNLLPESWRARRSQLVKRAEWRKRLIWIGGAYGALLLLFLIYLGLMRFEIGRLGRRIAKGRAENGIRSVGGGELKALAPAIDPRYYPVEILHHLSESLPSAGRAHHYLQPIGAADFDRWRSENRGPGLSIRRQSQEEPGLAGVCVRFVHAAADFAERSRAISPGGKTAMTPPKVYWERMNQRERRLVLLVAGILFILVNLFLWNWLFNVSKRERAELAARRATRKEQAIFLKDKNFWTKRDQWVQAHLPSLKNSAEGIDFSRSTQANCRQAQHSDRKSGHRFRRNDAQSSNSFRFHRNEKPVAAAGPFSLRRAATGCVRGLRQRQSGNRSKRCDPDAREV